MLALTLKQTVLTTRYQVRGPGPFVNTAGFDRTCLIGFQTIEQAKRIQEHITLPDTQYCVNFTNQGRYSTFWTPDSVSDIKVSLIKSPIDSLAQMIILNNFMLFITDDVVSLNNTVISLKGTLCDAEHDPSPKYLESLWMRSPN